MSDVKLFRITNGSAEELLGKPVKPEKKLQTLIEKHLETFLHVRYVATEYSTGKTHAGRIDTLGLDDNGCPTDDHRVQQLQCQRHQPGPVLSRLTDGPQGRVQAARAEAVRPEGRVMMLKPNHGRQWDSLSGSGRRE